MCMCLMRRPPGRNQKSRETLKMKLDHLGRIHARRIQSEPKAAILRNALYGSMVLAIRSLRRDEYHVVGRTCESTQVANIVRKYVGLCLIAGDLKSAQLAIKGRDRNSATASRFAIIAGDYDYEDSSRASIRFSRCLTATILIKWPRRGHAGERLFAYIWETKQRSNAIAMRALMANIYRRNGRVSK